MERSAGGFRRRRGRGIVSLIVKLTVYGRCDLRDGVELELIVGPTFNSLHFLCDYRSRFS